MFDCDPSEDKIDIPVLGIDLGTRFSCISVWRNKKFEIITDNFGNRTIPSVVSFYRSAKLVGHNALSLKEVSPANTIYDVKRIIGRRFTDPVIEQTQSLVSYEIIDDQSSHHNVQVQLDKSDITLSQKMIYRPEEICSYILTFIKNTAADYLKLDAKTKNNLKAVITVPAYFNDSQRQATLDAAKIAGLEIIKVINEPTAAALAYGLGNRTWKNNANGGNIIMYDFGAGTLDVSLINVKNGVFRTLAVGGNTHLGGEDIDYVVMNHLMFEFKKQHKIRELRISKLSQIKLKNAVENGKKILSSTDKTVICIDDFYNGHKLYHILTRNTLETVCNDLFIMCMKPLDDVLKSAELTKNDIDDIVMVGGSTRIPKIQSLILNFFSGTSITSVTTSMNPDEVVSAGASIYGYIMTHQEDPFSENLVLLDIIPLSLGVETLKKRMTVIIPRNTVIPTKKIKTFSTDEDDQDEVTIKIFEGERRLTKNNFHVGTFDLCGFKKAPRGHPVIKITFQVDINGILHVTANEKKSGVQNSIQITSTWGAKGRLSKNDIENLIEDAEKNEQIDMMYSTKIGLIDEIQSLCNSVACNVADVSFNLTRTDKKKIKMDTSNHLKWLAETKFEDLLIDELEKRLSRLKNLYSPLMAHSDKNKDQFTEKNIESNVAEIHGDDDDNEGLQQYEKITIPDDPSQFDKEEIKALKKTIFDLGKNIVSVINNPVSKFREEDIVMMSDYISSVNIWLYTTSAQTSIEFVAKINEINKTTEEMMAKYESSQDMFEKNENFTVRDELQLTCLTLNMSIRNNYFSLGSSNTDKLTQLINDTMIWTISHQNESPEVYKSKLDLINEMCNNLHHGMSKIKDLPVEESSEESDEISYPVPENNKIKENISLMINNLPDKITRRKPATPKKTDVLLKLDINKFIV
uniref:Uncharacterized protein n=1 Tax=viral metagenome TaxID=1070528 RepID=A0A6C0CBK0_9ZZZZ